MRQLDHGRHGGASRFWPLLLSTGLVLVLVLPWFSWQTHPHWERVQWSPLLRPSLRPARLIDAVANVMMYVPFGYTAARLWQRRSRWWLLGLALLLSLATELTQVYSHTRVPSGRDVSCNVFGALLGIGLGKWGASKLVT